MTPEAIETLSASSVHLEELRFMHDDTRYIINLMCYTKSVIVTVSSTCPQMGSLSVSIPSSSNCSEAVSHVLRHKGQDSQLASMFNDMAIKLRIQILAHFSPDIALLVNNVFHSEFQRTVFKTLAKIYAPIV